LSPDLADPTCLATPRAAVLLSADRCAASERYVEGDSVRATNDPCGAHNVGGGTGIVSIPTATPPSFDAVLAT